MIRLLPPNVSSCWIKGHATQADVLNNKITQINLDGNHGVDSLATRGRDLHALPAATTLGHAARKLITMVCQKLAIDLLMKRQDFREELENELITRHPPQAPLPAAEIDEPMGLGHQGLLENISEDTWTSITTRYARAPLGVPDGPYWYYPLGLCPKTVPLPMRGAIVIGPGCFLSIGIGVGWGSQACRRPLLPSRAARKSRRESRGLSLRLTLKRLPAPL